MDRRLILLFLSLCSFEAMAADPNSTESYELWLVGGASRCEGELQVERPGLSWAPVGVVFPDLRLAKKVCAELGCGAAVSVGQRRRSADTEVWQIKDECLESSLSDCSWTRSFSTATSVELKCAESVRLLRGPSLCSGSLELRWDQSWTPVCEEDFDLQDAEVVCRELGCGAPSLLQGALYGEGQALGQVFHCEGHESALMDCPRTNSGDTCSSGTAVELTCSEPDEVRLLGGAGRCDGTPQLKHLDEWRDVQMSEWTLKTAAAVCTSLDCGSALSLGRAKAPEGPVWTIISSCLRSTPALRECVSPDRLMRQPPRHDLTCSESVRLRGPSLCSGSLELRWDQSWTPVCEEDFDLQDAEVVCRELGCGAPSLLQGALYGEGQALGQVFHCEGHESALMDCPRTNSGDTCSSGTTVELTCSEPDEVRLVGGASRCAGTLELRHMGQWSPVLFSGPWAQTAAAVVCPLLDCGSFVSGEMTDDTPWSMWEVSSSCVRQTSALRDCVEQTQRRHSSPVHVLCSDLLNRPNISLSVPADGVSGAQAQGLSADGVSGAQAQGLSADGVSGAQAQGLSADGVSEAQAQGLSADGVSEAQAQGLWVLLGSDFSVRCSVGPQFPGGSFQLISPTQNRTLPAVNHSAHFLFSDAGPAHKGGYTCVYHLHVFSHNFSSQSHTLQLKVGVPVEELLIRAVVILLLKLTYILALYLHYCKATRGQQRTHQ